MTGRESSGPTRVSRRVVLLGATGAAVGTGALGHGTPAQAATSVRGADISWMPQMEAGRYHWNNSAGQRQDLFTILKAYGIAAVSLRTWVNPSSDPANGHCGIEETAAMAVRCWDITGLSSYAQGGYGKPVMQVEYGGPLNKPAQVRDSLLQFITGLKGFGGLGTFYWEPEGYSPFTSYGSSAWDPGTRRPTAAMDGFLA